MPPDPDSSEVQELEIKLAFLERANTELSDVVYAQQRTLAALLERVKVLEAQVDVLREAVMRTGE